MDEDTARFQEDVAHANRADIAKAVALIVEPAMRFGGGRAEAIALLVETIAAAIMRIGKGEELATLNEIIKLTVTRLLQEQQRQ